MNIPVISPCRKYLVPPSANTCMDQTTIYVKTKCGILVANAQDKMVPSTTKVFFVLEDSRKKIIVVLKKKNIWWMFMQMRTLMPVGMLMMLAGGIMCRGNVDFKAFFLFPAAAFFILGALGMVMMTVFAFVLDSSDLKSNWIEQLTNGFAQICFFAGLLSVVLR